MFGRISKSAALVFFIALFSGVTLIAQPVAMNSVWEAATHGLPDEGRTCTPWETCQGTDADFKTSVYNSIDGPVLHMEATNVGFYCQESKYLDFPNEPDNHVLVIEFETKIIASIKRIKRGSNNRRLSYFEGKPFLSQ